MARLSKPQLLSLVTVAINEAGWRFLYLSDAHPFELQIYSDVETYRVRAYIWNITHGGGSQRPANEYRIQITGVEQFVWLDEGKTLILGWSDDFHVFAAWDFNYHDSTLGSSPSLQIHQSTLESAYTDGFAVHEKGNQELAIAFRPAFLVDYIRSLESLHAFGQYQSDLNLLGAVAHDPYAPNDAEIAITDIQRQTTIRSVRQSLRSSNFRARVLSAYDHKCAFCGVQLNLVQAAHILPVSHEAGTDETFNGIASCYLHHAAYDRALITFDETYHIHVNETQIAELMNLNRGGGADQFREALHQIIALPADKALRPHVGYIEIANDLRGWGL